MLKTGKTWRSSSFSVAYKKNCFLEDRFSVIVSKRHGIAVKRNKIKRIFREIFRTHKRRNPPFFDFIFKPEVKIHFSQKEITNELVSWFSQLRKESFQL